MEVQILSDAPISNWQIRNAFIEACLPMKYTQEILEVPVKESKSYAEVLRRLGVKQCGGTQRNITQRVKQLGLDTSHFLGQKRNSGNEHCGGPDKLHWTQILVRCRLSGNRKESTSRLRRAMLESGVPYICQICKCAAEWNGRPLTLQVDHIDGDWLNNEPDNVRFLCPNCHAQTPNFGSKNRNRLTELGIDELYMYPDDFELEE